MQSLRISTLTTFALLSTVAPAAAQVPLTPRALGTGGAYSALARGFESVFHNAANLGLADGPAWSVAFPQVSIGASVLGPNVGDLPDFINFDDISDERRQELLDLIPESGTSVDLMMRAPVAAVQVGRFGVGLSYGLFGEHTVGKDLIELLFEGYEQGRFDYRVGNTVGTRGSYWDLTAGYGYRLGALSVGAAAHLYRAGTLVRTRAFEPVIDPFARTIRVDYVGVYSRGGSGYGLDLGAAYALPGLVLNASISNLAGSLDWNDKLVGRRLSLTEADFADPEFLVLERRWKESETDLGTDPDPETLHGRVAADLDPRAWDVPSTLRLGAAWSAGSGTTVAGQVESELGSDDGGLLSDRWHRLFGVGVQQRIPYATLRLGASSDFDGGTMIGGGVRFGVIDLALARFSTAGVLSDADRDGWIASMSVNVETDARVR